MTKPEFQKELKERITPGVKPSHLKKLKRSKSEGDIPKTPTSVPVKKSQSQLEIPLTQPSPEKTLTELQAQIRFHSQTAQNYLKSLQVSQAKVSELEEQLKNKSLNQLTALDNSLFARHKSLKDWFSQYAKNKKLDQELVENIDEASTELLNQDKTISQLRSEQSRLKEQNSKLKLTNQSLTKDLDLATKLAQMRKNPLPDNSPPLPYLKWGLYSLTAVLFALWLLNNKN